MLQSLKHAGISVDSHSLGPRGFELERARQGRMLPAIGNFGRRPGSEDEEDEDLEPPPVEKSTTEMGAPEVCGSTSAAS